MNLYGDIPEDTAIKPYLPIMRGVWDFYQQLGWELTTQLFEEFEKCAYYFFEDRLNESIKTSRAIMNGKLNEEQAKKTLSYIITLPPVTIRSDLTSGTTKLVGGESFDVTWIALSDISKEVFIFLNAHCEDGIPVDWWIVRSDDELLDRRHMKLGIKIRDMPKKLKNINQLASRIRSVLFDIRNERTPEWGQSLYLVAPVWVTACANYYCAGTNFETQGEIYDGWGAKKIYNLPEPCFTFDPFPTILSALFNSGRESWIQKICQLLTEGQMYYQPIEERTRNYFHESFPEMFDILLTRIAKGLPFPIQSINAEMPNVKNKNNPDDRFQLKYPSKEFINTDDLGLSLDELVAGVFFDITPETKPGTKIDESIILSKGVGMTTYYK